MDYFVSVTRDAMKNKDNNQAEFDMSERCEVGETLPALGVLQKYLYVSNCMAK